MKGRMCPKMVLNCVLDVVDIASENLQEPGNVLDLSILGPMKQQIQDASEKDDEE